MTNQKFYSTIVISDVHLGTEHSKAEELARFLKTVNCKTLILNGDIIDGWHLQKGGRWKAEHTNLIKIIMKMMENHDTKVVYVRGNHDDFIDQIAPFNFSNISVVKDYTHYNKGKTYYITHGDIFDNITSKMIWLAKLGDIGYSILLWLNGVYNLHRARKGLPYFSLSQSIKQKVKSAVSYISDFETELVTLAKARHADGVICGHIHQPANRYIDGIHYLNSGDWVESLSALLEHEDGTWEVYYHSEDQHNYESFDTLMINNSRVQNRKVSFSLNFFMPVFKFFF